MVKYNAAYADGFDAGSWMGVYWEKQGPFPCPNRFKAKEDDWYEGYRDGQEEFEFFRDAVCWTAPLEPSTATVQSDETQQEFLSPVAE